MKYLLIVFFFFSFLIADEFDFFDTNDNNSFENNISNSTFKLKLSYENNKNMNNQVKYLLFNHTINEKDYYLNYEILKNTNNYNINLKWLINN